MNSLVGVAAPSDPVGSVYSENPSSVEGGDVEQVCSNLEIILSCLRLLSLSLTCLYILHVHLYMLDIHCAILLYAWGLFAHTCIQPREP